MKFTVNREKLQKALQRVGSIIGARSMLPLLGNVLIEAGENGLTLCTTDLDIRITTGVEAEVAEPGRSTVPARRLTSLVASFTADTVEINVDDKDHFKISCGTGRFTLLGLPAADFPEPAEFDSIRELKLKESDFKRMITAIGYAVSADDSRKVLTGVLMNCHDSILTMVATDGKRMAMQERAPEVFNGADGDAIGKEGKGETPDHPHDGKLREEHLAHMIAEHAQAGDHTDETGIPAGPYTGRLQTGTDEGRGILRQGAEESGHD